MVNAGLVGEKVFSDAVKSDETGQWELFVTKPYLTDGMITINFNSNRPDR